MKIFQLGYPGNMGGANTECWHTVKLWRGAGIDVGLIPTWGSDEAWEAKLTGIGATTHKATEKTLADVPGLPGSIVVGMCNRHALACLPQLRAMGCKLVWVNCMTFLFPDEDKLFRRHGVADAFLFQSEFQRDELQPKLQGIAGLDNPIDDRCHLIHGAFDATEFPFEPRPHSPGEDFVVGRLARPDADKWSSNMWRIFERIPYAQRKALAMGWTPKLARKCGDPPKWATALPPQKVTSQAFLGRCHCMMPINGGAKENWPRIGLEAMAAGVPIVAPNQWGWREMIPQSGRCCGYLADNDGELAYYASCLAYEPELRTAIAENARDRVEKLCDPATLWPKWEALFQGLGA